MPIRSSIRRYRLHLQDHQEPAARRRRHPGERRFTAAQGGADQPRVERDRSDAERGQRDVAAPRR